MRFATVLTALSVLGVACGGEAGGVADPRDGGSGGSSGSGQGGASGGGTGGGSGGAAGSSGTSGGTGGTGGTAASGGSSGSGGAPCSPAKPFDPPGVTAAYEGAAGEPLTIISKDRYWSYDWSAGWTAAGWLDASPVWSNAPAVGGTKPYQGAGVTAAYNNPSVTLLSVISKDKYWIYERSSGTWTGSGSLATAWASAPSIAGVKPFDGDGVTAAYNDPSGSALTVVSRDKYWVYVWSSSTWSGGGLLSDAWASAPSVAGVKPFEGAGVTASYNDPSLTTLTVISADKYWQYAWSTGTWSGSGLLSEGWAGAPEVACP